MSKTTSKALGRKKPRCVISEEKLRARKFGVVSSATATPGLMTYTGLIRHIQDMKRDLEKGCPSSVAATVVMDVSKLIATLVVPASDQGALIHITSESDDHLATSSLREAEEIAACARGVSIAAVDFGNVLINKSTQSSMSQEDIHGELNNSVDETVTRQVYARSAGPAREIDYLDVKRVFGGGPAVPLIALSEREYRLTGCRLRMSGKDRLEVVGDTDDSEWHRLNATYPDCVTLGKSGDTSTARLLRLALAYDLCIDMVVCIGERISNGRCILSLVEIGNVSTLLKIGQQEIDLITEDYSLR